MQKRKDGDSENHVRRSQSLRLFKKKELLQTADSGEKEKLAEQGIVKNCLSLSEEMHVC